jgi:hypothetical protein
MRIKRRIPAIVAMAVLLTAIWYLLSGKFDVLHFGTGVLTALLIALNYRPVGGRHGLPCGPFRRVRALADRADRALEPARRADRAAPTMPISPAFVSSEAGGGGRARAHAAGREHRR